MQVMSTRRSRSITINPENGNVLVEDFALTVFRGAMIESVRRELAALIYAESDMQTGYVWVRLQSVSFGNQPAAMSLCFFEDKLQMVTLGIALPDDDVDGNWPTEVTSWRHVAFMRKELERQLLCSLDQQNFSWGSAWSNFDIKGFRASAGICYG
jgi:hypothetical protein